MTISLTSLIDDVAARSPSAEPLQLLGTAASTVELLIDTSDALLSHFVEACRQAGHSWTEIGGALGVTKQAVQKRFTGGQTTPRGWEMFTPRACRVVEVHAPAAAAELGNNYLGTEHLLAGLFGEHEGVAAKVLEAAGVTRAEVLAAVDSRVARGQQGQGGFTPRAWAAIENASRIALEQGIRYVGTEHLLLSLMTGVGGIGVEILSERGVTIEQIRTQVGAVLGESLATREDPVS
jgi:hypothetical protein